MGRALPLLHHCTQRLSLLLLGLLLLLLGFLPLLLGLLPLLLGLPPLLHESLLHESPLLLMALSCRANSLLAFLPQLHFYV